MAGRTALYTVRDADIWCEAGRASIGDTVELDAAEARHFNAIGVLAPYIPDDEATEVDIGGTEPEPVKETEHTRPVKETENTRASRR